MTRRLTKTILAILDLKSIQIQGMKAILTPRVNGLLKEVLRIFELLISNVRFFKQQNQNFWICCTMAVMYHTSKKYASKPSLFLLKSHNLYQVLLGGHYLSDQVKPIQINGF